jgi:hypothetical protein
VRRHVRQVQEETVLSFTIATAATDEGVDGMDGVPGDAVSVEQRLENGLFVPEIIKPTAEILAVVVPPPEVAPAVVIKTTARG